MSILIRRANKGDCPRLMELVQELADFERAPDEVTVSLEHFESSGFSNAPVWWAFVAEDPVSDKIVAFALYYIRYSTWKGQRLYLEDLIVTEPWRGKGIGKMLFERLLLEMKEKGFSGMVWQALEWNQPALDFYTKYGATLDGEWINCSLNA